MKIQYVSDLHLEFPENRRCIESHPIIPSADILVIAGDTGYLTKRRKNHIFEKYTDKFFEYCSKNWKHVIVIPGNHEWYGGCPMNALGTKYIIKDNIEFLNNASTFIQTDKEYDLQIFGSTLWSNIPQENYDNVYNSMNDYRLIQYAKGVWFMPGMSIEKHFQTCSKISTLLNKPERLTHGHVICGTSLKGDGFIHKPYKLLILTHHGCHPQCINEKYNGSSLNSAYYTDLSNLIDKIQPEAWVFGHTHHTQSFKYNDTIIAENSLGYIEYGESDHFKRDLILEI